MKKYSICIAGAALAVIAALASVSVTASPVDAIGFDHDFMTFKAESGNAWLADVDRINVIEVVKNSTSTGCVSCHSDNIKPMRYTHRYKNTVADDDSKSIHAAYHVHGTGCGHNGKSKFDITKTALALNGDGNLSGKIHRMNL